MLQVKNDTPFVPGFIVAPDPSGADTLYVSIKATFELNPKGLRVAEEQSPIAPADVYWGDPAQSSLKYAGELHPCQPATDVVLLGAAYAPEGRPAADFALLLEVGRLKKIVQVFGDRVWQVGAFGIAPSRPTPTVKVPLLFERAYGGRHDLEAGPPLIEPRNPVGVGFRGKRSPAELKGLPVPNLLDPRHAIESPSDHPAPVGLGYLAPSWQPRASWGGTYDEVWRRKRAPFLPDDFDPRFYQAAPPDQVYPGYLQGGELVALVNAAPEGVQRFTLPSCELGCEALIAGQPERVPLRIGTLLLEPDQGRFSLIWRGAAPCDKRMLQIEEVRVTVSKLTGVTS